MGDFLYSPLLNICGVITSWSNNMDEWKHNEHISLFYVNEEGDGRDWMNKNVLLVKTKCKMKVIIVITVVVLSPFVCFSFGFIPWLLYTFLELLHEIWSL